jgi:hypothetical protein
MSKQLSTIPVGAIVKSVNTKYNGAVIRFKIGRQAPDRVGLVTERIISLKCFDAKEPSNSNSDRRNYGNNRAAVANLLQWMNSAAGAGQWYSAQHSADAPPNNANVWSNYNEYEAEAGFLNGFEQDFRDALLDDTITVAKSSTDGGGSEQITRKVRLLTRTEVFGDTENGTAEGTQWPIFTDNNSRLAYPTAEAVSKSEYKTSSLSSSQPWWWWLLTPYAGYATYVRNVHSDGSLGNNYAWYGYYGVRPALFLAPDTLVSDTTDTDGAYIIQWNQPPTTPSSISHGTPRAGQSLTITTGGSTDPEGDAISYVWERRVDSGAYTQIGITTAKSIVDTVPSSGTNYQVRVKAVDANGAESAYRTGNATPISYNTDPVISGSDQNLGAKTDPFTYDYTVTDSEAASQTLTVTETVTNGTETITLRTYTATSGTQNTADLSDVWLRLLTGSHVLKIYVTDGAGGSATRLITFSRTVTRIAASRAIATDAKVEKVFLSLYPADHPADATLHVEVTNNPFDDSPAWEDITSKVGKFVHTFTNTTVASSSYGLAYRFYMTKGTQEIEVIQATVRFA